MLNGVERNLNPAAHIEFLENILNVNLDGAFCQIKLAGDFLVALTERQRRHDVAFTRGKPAPLYAHRISPRLIAHPLNQF
jgi:hypothetical protein